VLGAPSSRAPLAAAIYAVGVAALFASSALYHRMRWLGRGEPVDAPAWITR
jgi:predicted membrane channel-forming protein YqfA (hemolysin III family)